MIPDARTLSVIPYSPSLPPRSLAQEIGFAMSARPASVTWPGGVVSFTFDDFPKSALAVGGDILERYGARGTYYASLKLAQSDNHMWPIFDDHDIRAAHRAGHEIACHTFTHPDLRHMARPMILAEVRNNAAALSSLIEGFLPTNFAYPYGGISILAKRVLRFWFSSCRGIDRGINYGTVDLADLRAVPLYAADFDGADIRRLIDRTCSLAGWLIFFTHDVTGAPSPFGCRPVQLEAVVAYAAERSTILPVRDVIAGLPNFNPFAARYLFVRKTLKEHCRRLVNAIQ
jgi:peptidoglycan/xylan/chitin deacetylase (PgdA/CDA1 family)